MAGDFRIAPVSLNQAFQLISEELRKFAEMPEVENLSGKEALIAAANALLKTNDSIERGID